MRSSGDEAEVYVNTGVSDCYQQRMVETRRGLRLRVVNVCGYGIY